MKKTVIVDDEHIRILTELGLTLLQAKTYLALSQTGKATIATIAKTAHVARQDTYRIIPVLEKLGLAEKIIAAPTMYKATSIKEGYYLLLQKKTTEYIELQKKTINLIKKARGDSCKSTLQDEAHQFFLISSKTLHAKKIDFEDSTTHISLDVICSLKFLSVWMFCHLQTYEKALKRGVKIRIITELDKGKKSLQKISVLFKGNPLFEIRYISTVPISAAIYDRRKVSMSTRTPQDNEVTPSLWSTNPQFVEVMTTYFEDLWNKTLNTPATLDLPY